MRLLGVEVDKEVDEMGEEWPRRSRKLLRGYNSAGAADGMM
jgi:hypothetical protein